jgi:hypothetical protein
MLRAVATVIMVTFMLPQAHTEEAIPPALRWSAVTSPPRSAISTNPDVIHVQEPFCEYGVGPCGGTCSEEGGKHWACATNEMPCYQLGRCKCEAANICKPPPPPKKKKNSLGEQ